MRVTGRVDVPPLQHDRWGGLICILVLVLHDRDNLDFMALRSGDKHSAQGRIIEKAVKKAAKSVYMVWARRFFHFHSSSSVGVYMTAILS